MEPGSSVIRFPMKPDVDRCFGHMAAALDLNYWTIPNVTSFYIKIMTSQKTKRSDIVMTLDHVIRIDGRESILRDQSKVYVVQGSKVRK
eukprot:TRINITY_DN6489_c0_g1_i1.p1 TRINITY_DN6489_c0_g1~~TRINITY_DN6489_c0_g1_i1.p1  ORF type:complete len:103 (-),score=4.50 TRINITY_DN6489_c0_g1_i1:222-488(-)